MGTNRLFIGDIFKRHQLIIKKGRVCLRHTSFFIKANIYIKNNILKIWHDGTYKRHRGNNK